MKWRASDLFFFFFFFHKRCQANRRAMALLPASAMARLSHEGLGSTVVQWQSLSLTPPQPSGKAVISNTIVSRRCSFVQWNALAWNLSRRWSRWYLHQVSSFWSMTVSNSGNRKFSLSQNDSNETILIITVPNYGCSKQRKANVCIKER